MTYDNLTFMANVQCQKGCSSGIGKSTAVFFAKYDFKVWATMRNVSKWDLKPNPNIVVTQMDVTSDNDVNGVVNRLIEEEGQIDILVNNAGYGLNACLELAHISEAKKMFDVNVWG